MLTGKTIVLGVTGGIAAYKAADLASKLTQDGATVDVIMTKAATEFITPLTFRSLTNRPVVTGVFELASEFSVEHVALAEAADLVVIAPATANTIAKLAAGIADDMLSCTVLATEVPVVVAPAMNVNMWQNPVTAENVAKLQARGFTIVGPGYGRLATGRIGMGRLVDVTEILGAVRQVLGRNGDLAGRRITVTAGGTREAIDPVRYIGNRSSGKMGFAIAEAARDRGASVSLIAAPSGVPIPTGVDLVSVESVTEMKDAVASATAQTDALIMAAAPADYVARNVAGQKIKKGADDLTVELVKAPDIISQVTGDFLKVAFAAETENLVANARKKLDSKSADLVVANDVTVADSGFGSDTNKVTLIGADGQAEELPLMTKREVADRILDRVAALLAGQRRETMTSVKIKLTRVSLQRGEHRVRVPKDGWRLFPTHYAPIELNADDVGVMPLHFNPKYHELSIGKWLRVHPELRAGDTIVISEIEPMKKYRLEIARR